MEKLTFEQCQKSKEGINKKIKEQELKLTSFPREKSGFIKAIYRKTPEYIEARKQFNFWFDQLRQINSYINKHYKKESNELIMKNRLQKT